MSVKKKLIKFPVFFAIYGYFSFIYAFELHFGTLISFFYAEKFNIVTFTDFFIIIIFFVVILKVVFGLVL